MPSLSDVVRLNGVSRWFRSRLYLASMPTRAISDVYGFDRGLPADRQIVLRHLAQNAACIRGRCLEVGGDDYVRQFGGERVSHVDVLDIDPGNPRATIVADLQDLATVPDNAYDCAIITFVLQLLPDPRRGIGELWRILDEGGTALVTLPALHRVDPSGNGDLWRFMPDGAAALFGDLPWDVDVDAWGNAALGIAMWTGMAVQDLPKRTWRVNEPSWPCVVTATATKPRGLVAS